MSWPQDVERFAIPDDIMDRFARHIKPIGIAVYAVLAQNVNILGSCNLSHKEIAKNAHVSKASVMSSLSLMEKLGIIRVYRIKTENGGQFSNTYILLDHDELAELKAPHELELSLIG